MKLESSSPESRTEVYSMTKLMFFYNYNELLLSKVNEERTQLYIVINDKDNRREFREIF